MKRIFCLLSFGLACMSSLFAETTDSLSVDEDLRPNTSFSIGIGMGSANRHVSYLSPLLYSGESIELWAERIKRIERRNKTFFSLANLNVQKAFMTPMNEQNEMVSSIYKFDYHYYYDWKLAPKFHMLLGGYADVEYGTDELTTSIGNNPAYLRLDFTLAGITLRPTLCLQAKRRVIRLSNQFDLRLAGITHSPTFTEPYYEMELTGVKKTDFFGFNTFADKFSLSNKFMADIPLRKTTMRLGMSVDRSKSMIKQIDTRSLNVKGILGFSFDYRPVSGRKNKQKTIFE